MSYQLVKLSSLSAKPTTYSVVSSDVVYATIGTQDVGVGALSSVKLNMTDIADSVYVHGAYSQFAHWVRDGSNLYKKEEFGNVGIGDSDPGGKLTVTGLISATQLGVQGPSNYFLGNVGIGTTEPVGMLDLKGSSAGEDDPNVRLTHLSGGYSELIQGTAILYLSVDEGNEVAGSGIQFEVDGASKMHLNNNGYLGINTNNPKHFLHVNAGSTSTVAISAYGMIHSGGDIVAFSTSDERFKDDVMVIDDPLGKIDQIRGVKFKWNSLAEDIFSNNPAYVGEDYGVIAQEVEEILPEIVEDREIGYKAVRYEKLIPLLVECIKELSDRVKTLEGNS